MTSDPFITSLRRPTKKKTMEMSREASKLLIDVSDDQHSDSESDTSLYGDEI